MEEKATETKQKLTPKQTLVQVLKFVLFSCGAGIIQTLVFTLLNEVFHLNYWVSYFIALVMSVLYNFTVNRRYTFKSASNVPKAMLLVLLFYCAFTPYSLWLTNLLTVGKGVNEYAVLAICMVQNLALEFLWCRLVVYRKSMNSNKLAKKEEEQKSDEFVAEATDNPEETETEIEIPEDEIRIEDIRPVEEPTPPEGDITEEPADTPTEENLEEITEAPTEENIEEE